ncbi:MAG: hypothetical protein BJ554DRAFT_1453, partial [Olpidium bornovanus]
PANFEPIPVDPWLRLLSAGRHHGHGHARRDASPMTFPCAARLAGAFAAVAAAVAAAVVVVVLPGRSAALAAPNGDPCAPLPVAMTNREFEEASELPVPLDCSEVTELAEYARPVVATSERKILVAASGAPDARAIFRKVVECPVCHGCMHYNKV